LRSDSLEEAVRWAPALLLATQADTVGIRPWKREAADAHCTSEKLIIIGANFTKYLSCEFSYIGKPAEAKTGSGD
ncbi:MAG: hypothetical protein M1823_007977, partial [Watsoniomyces obsoletus]